MLLGSGSACAACWVQNWRRGSLPPCRGEGHNGHPACSTLAPAERGWLSTCRVLPSPSAAPPPCQDQASSQGSGHPLPLPPLALQGSTPSHHHRQVKLCGTHLLQVGPGRPPLKAAREARRVPGNPEGQHPRVATLQAGATKNTNKHRVCLKNNGLEFYQTDYCRIHNSTTLL